MSDKFKEAFDFAFDVHKNDVRKNGGAPYISHPIGVASLIFEYGGNEEQAIAGLFHDVLEEHYKVEYLDKIDSFGASVLNIVGDCTDWMPGVSPKKPDWKKRKEIYLYEMLPEASLYSGVVIIADKLYNARSIVKNLYTMGEKTWDIFRGKKKGTLWYYEELVTALIKKYPRLEILYEFIRTIGKMSSKT